MGILHSGITQSSLVLRSETGQRLSILQFDGNFVYLEDLVLGVSQSLASLPLVPAGGTGGQVLAKVSGTDYDLEWVDQTGGTGGTGNGTNGTSGTSGVNGVVGTSGTSGVNGVAGTNGTSGINGADGVGIPSGGTASWILSKKSDTDYDVEWVENTGGGGAGNNGTNGTSGIDGTNGTSGTSGLDGLNGTNGTSGISANLESINNIFVLGTYSPPLGSTQSTGMGHLNFTKGDELMFWVPVEENETFLRIPLEWDIQFLGITYSSVYVNSNSYVTFGTSSTSTLAAPGMVGAPAIFIATGDNYLGSIYFGFDPLTDFYRIRFEGSPDTTGFIYESTIVWEMIFNIATPDQIKVVVGSSTAGNFRNPGGIYGISDGVNWVERITPVPTYDEKTNKMLDSIDIYSIKESSPSYSDSLSSIKFVGPGVYRNLEGTTATINIDPLGQYGLGLNYNPAGFVSANGQTVLSSTRFELLLTTGKDESAMRLRPRGDLFLQPYNRNVDQFGNGFNINVVASNAARDNVVDDLYPDFDGGSIFITPGAGIGAGYPGDVNIGRVGSFVAITGTLVANGATGFTGTYSTGAGQVVTVESGIITDVA